MENKENLVEEGTTELSRSNISDVKQRLNANNTKPSKALSSPTKKPGLVENVKRETSFASVVVEQRKSTRNQPTIVVKQPKSEITIFKESTEEPTIKKINKKLVEKHEATHTHDLRNAPPQKDDQEKVINELKKEIEDKKEANRLKQAELKQLNADIKAVQEELEQHKAQQQVQAEAQAQEQQLKEEVAELKGQVEELESTNNELDELIESLNEKGKGYEAQREEKQNIIDELLNTLSETKYKISEIKEEAAAAATAVQN